MFSTLFNIVWWFSPKSCLSWLAIAFALGYAWCHYRNRDPARYIRGGDYHWFAAETDSHPVHVIGCIDLDAVPPPNLLKQIVIDRFVRPYRRFRCIPRLGGPSLFGVWAADKDFSIDNHVRYVPDSRSDREVDSFCSELMSKRIPHDHPLWCFYVLSREDGRCTLAIAIHHVYCDGVGLSEVLLNMTDGGVPVGTENSLVQTRGGSRHTSFASTVLPFVISLGKAIYKLITLPNHPDPDSPIRGKPSGHKLIARVPAIDLERVRVLARGMHVTINDVMLSCATKALQKAWEPDTPIPRLRTMVPVSIRPPAAVTDLTLMNYFSVLYTDIPTDKKSASERLSFLHHSMEQLKVGAEPALAWVVLKTMSVIPVRILKAQLDNLTKCASVCITNVAGPKQQIRFAGQNVEQLRFFAPIAGAVTTGVSIASYNGKIHAAIIVDQDATPRPDVMVTGFEAELRELEEVYKAKH